MPQRSTRHVSDMVKEAASRITELSPQEVASALEKPETVLVDLRDIRERTREGYIEAALHVPRGMLEFWIDPESPYHKPVFQEDKQFIFHCASGWRSALAADTAKSMGLAPVAHMKGGFNAWVKSGGPVKKRRPELRRKAIENS